MEIANKYLVEIEGDKVKIKRASLLPFANPAEEMLQLAAWIVEISQPLTDQQFSSIQAEVREKSG